MIWKCAGTVLLTVLVTVAAEDWSWGPAEGSQPDNDSSPVPGVSPASEGREEPAQGSDRQPRFLGLENKLCALGIGLTCPNKKPIATSLSQKVPSSYTSYDQPGAHADNQVTSSYTSYAAPPAGRHPSPQYTPPPHHQQQQQQQKQVVQHHHEHTHIHQTPGGIPAIPQQTLPSHHASSHPNRPQHGNFNPLPSSHGDFNPLQPSHGSSNPSSHHHQPHLPHHGPVDLEAIVPHGTPIAPLLTPGYKEDCVCVHASLCAAYDVVGREELGDIIHLIDPRTRGSDILSNDTLAEDEEDNVNSTTATTATATTTTTTTKTPEAAARVKRDLLPAKNNTAALAEGRALSYRPGAAGCGASYVCCRNPLSPQGPIHTSYTCGRGNPSGVLARVKTPDYIPGTAHFGEFPWHAAILKNYEEYVCGGVLVDDRHVLTAAHCVHGLAAHNLKVRLGDWDVSISSEFYRHVELPAEWVVQHPEYYGGDLSNDLAVIRLKGYLDFAANPHIVPVCLPPAYTSFVGQRCISTGWGKDAFGNHGSFQRILQKVEVPVVGRKTCEAALSYTRLGPHFKLSEGSLCAGGEEGRDTCEGDGGGPLVCAGPGGAYQLAGLVSWGIGCGNAGVPGVYVDVAHYDRWIRNIVSVP